MNLAEARMQGLVAPTPQNDPEMARVAAQSGGNSQMDALTAAIASLAEGQAKQAAAMEMMATKMKNPKKNG